MQVIRQVKLPLVSRLIEYPKIYCFEKVASRRRMGVADRWNCVVSAIIHPPVGMGLLTMEAADHGHPGVGVVGEDDQRKLVEAGL